MAYTTERWNSCLNSVSVTDGSESLPTIGANYLLELTLHFHNPRTISRSLNK